MIYQNEDMRCDCNVCDLLQRCQYRYVQQRLPVRHGGLSLCPLLLDSLHRRQADRWRREMEMET